MTISPTQMQILTAAAQHEARLAKPPERLPAGARNAVFRSMLKSALMTEVPAPPEHVGLGWRQDEASAWIALRITEKGLTFIGLDPAVSTPVSAPGDNEAAMTSDSPPISSKATSRPNEALALQPTLRAATFAVIAAWEAAQPLGLASGKWRVPDDARGPS
jgi:hypothetical protein